ncbi:oligoendopeptidase F [Solimicrobium silvestre]|uniref:Oligopeptidase F n=1 Tax=Solimicrobium silvestre TaxID=2099400 RepID=A0A2S9GZ62_9BURK|nr:oligoendopeptidase F [Solimicrobium silvestre]PRC92997.1 pepF: oligoendopeptidase F [Solimicrobium silvestre]
MTKNISLATTLAATFTLVSALLPSLSSAAETENDRWNLADLYATQDAWEFDSQQLEKQLKEFSACQGKLGESVKRFKSCLDLNADMVKRFVRLSSYASQSRDQDTGATLGQDLSQRADILAVKLDEATSFIRPEILKLGANKVTHFINQDKTLQQYRHFMDGILRTAPHTLDASGESLVANFGSATNAGQSVYTTLSNADMPWPTVKLSDGTEVKLDQAAYTKYRAADNRADRKIVFDAFWGKWKEFERTYGVTFYEQLKKESVYTKVRHYPDSLTRALDGNNLPPAVYNMLIEQTHANLPTLHRYFKLRAKMLGVTDLHYYDIYPPIVSSNLKYPVEQGKELMLAAVQPLGSDYVAAMQNGLQHRWMDVYPRPHKLSGAYMNGAVYDVHPYLLLNYNDDYESISTLAHEWGHAMHSYLANKAQPYINADYPTFTAEIASTTNEVFMLDHMLKIAKNDDEKLLYLGSALENLRGTFFRQAMFADFERTVHAKVDKGESLTGEDITKIYTDILKRYHGDAEGVMKIDDLYGIEWAYIPHFYNQFYVFQYATSIAAGSMFAGQILSHPNDKAVRENYLNVLRSGGSADPYDVVKAAGVDLASPAPYQAIFARMNSIMDQIEAIQKKR